MFDKLRPRTKKPLRHSSRNNVIDAENFFLRIREVTRDFDRKEAQIWLPKSCSWPDDYYRAFEMTAPNLDVLADRLIETPEWESLLNSLFDVRVVVDHLVLGYDQSWYELP